MFDVNILTDDKLFFGPSQTNSLGGEETSSSRAWGEGGREKTLNKNEKLSNIIRCNKSDQRVAAMTLLLSLKVCEVVSPLLLYIHPLFFIHFKFPQIEREIKTTKEMSIIVCLSPGE